MILDPPSVEGWQTGKEWINSGSLVGRVNFVADQVRNADLPGIRRAIKRITSNGTVMTAEGLVDRCLDLMGPLEVGEDTRKELVEQTESEGIISWATTKSTPASHAESETCSR